MNYHQSDNRRLALDCRHLSRGRWRRTAPTLAVSGLIAIGTLIAAAGAATVANAADCFNTTAPGCGNGWEFKTSGVRVPDGFTGRTVEFGSCCKIAAACGPGQYGKPGCPYPLFRQQSVTPPAAGELCGNGMYKGGDGQCYPKLN